MTYAEWYRSKSDVDTAMFRTLLTYVKRYRLTSMAKPCFFVLKAKKLYHMFVCKKTFN